MSDMRVKYALLGVTIVATLGILTASMVPAVTSPTSNMGLLMGHVTVVATDGDGNVKHYFQSDNIVIEEGTDCALIAIFGSADGTGETCPVEAIADFDVIALGANALSPTSTITKAVWNAATEVARERATINEFSALNEVNLTETFTVQDDGSEVNLLDDNEDIATTALFDDLTGGMPGSGNMIAVFDLPQVISGLERGDDLTIEWIVTGSQPT